MTPNQIIALIDRQTKKRVLIDRGLPLHVARVDIVELLRTAEKARRAAAVAVHRSIRTPSRD